MKRRVICIAALMFLLFIPTSAKANSLPPPPTPDFSIQIVNPPQEPFCIWVLTEEASGASAEDFSRLVSNADQNMVLALLSMQENGWYPVLEAPDGGIIRAAGDNKVEWKELSQKTLEYRLILSTKSGIVQTTEPQVRRDYSNSAVYNASTNQVEQKSVFYKYLIRVGVAIAITLAIELAILNPLGFSIRKNWKLVVLTNLVTQIIMHSILFYNHYFEINQDVYHMILWLELVIPIVEATVFAIFMKERTVIRRIFYALVANPSSFVTGVILYTILGLW